SSRCAAPLASCTRWASAGPSSRAGTSPAKSMPSTLSTAAPSTPNCDPSASTRRTRTVPAAHSRPRSPPGWPAGAIRSRRSCAPSNTSRAPSKRHWRLGTVTDRPIIWSGSRRSGEQPPGPPWVQDGQLVGLGPHLSVYPPGNASRAGNRDDGSGPLQTRGAARGDVQVGGGVADFSSMGLNAAVLQAVNDLGFEEPSPVQAEAIPILLAGRDLVAQAMTGTGKTAAFGI